MNTIFKTSAAALAMATFAMSAPAMAQESGSVPASAELYQGPPPVETLEIEPFQAAAFGRVKIPSGIRPGSRCEYSMQINSDGSDLVREYRELDESGMVIGSNSPTATDCGWDAVDMGNSSTTAGSFFITCVPDREVNYLIKMTSAESGVVFSSPTFGRAAYFTNQGENLGVFDTNNFNATCTGNVNVEGLVTNLVAAGAKILVTENAQVSNGAIDVGTITLEAAY